MPEKLKSGRAERIIAKALEFGASLAGIADVREIKKSPSYMVYEHMEIGGKKTGIPKEISWPENARSAVIIAVEHPEQKPEWDWWRDGCAGGTEGNRILISVIDKLIVWLREEKGIEASDVPYYIEQGGIFLKDAAVMAGLGCVGRNNLLVTEERGPRVRLRAMFINESLPGTDPVDFDPCQDCGMPCREACPRKSFAKRIYSEAKTGLEKLPGRTGHYSRSLCNIQMRLDVDNHDILRVPGLDKPGKLVRYCRICELACPVGES